MALALPALAPVVAAVSTLSQGPSPAAVQQLDGALADLADLLIPEKPSELVGVRTAIFAGADADLRVLATHPGDAEATRRAMRGIYTLAALGIALQVDPERELWAKALELVDPTGVAVIAVDPEGGLATLGKALWSLAPPVVIAGFVSDAAAGKLPAPLERGLEAAKGAAGSLLVPIGVGVGLGLVALFAWRSRR